MKLLFIKMKGENFMQKLIYETLCGGRKDRYLRGVKESMTWIPMRYDGGPKESGEYLVSDGKGKVFKLLYVCGKEECRDLFDQIVNGYDTYINDVNNNELTADELIEAVYKGYNVWYEIDYFNTGDGFHDTYYTLYIGDNVPKYYLESKLCGPVDDDLESYEEILVDKELNIIINSEEEEL